MTHQNDIRDFGQPGHPDPINCVTHDADWGEHHHVFFVHHAHTQRALIVERQRGLGEQMCLHPGRGDRNFSRLTIANAKVGIGYFDFNAEGACGWIS